MKKEKRKNENSIIKNKTISILVTSLLFIAILVCIICDLAILGKLTWSKITTSSIMFAWLILIPIMTLGKKGISISLAILSVIVIPYLYILSILIKENMIFTIGIAMSIIAIIYAWCIFWIFKLLQKRKNKAMIITLLLSIPVYLIINIILSKMILEPIIDIWDILSIIIIIIFASILFIYDYIKNKNEKNM